MELDSLQVLQTTQALEILEKLRDLDLPLDGTDIESVLAIVMGIFGVFFVPFIAIVLIVWLIFRYRHKQNKLKSELIIKAIEHGQTIPNDFFETTGKNPLKKGIIWTSTGLGIILFFVMIGFTGNKGAFSGIAVGIIPMFVGLGHLLFHFFDKEQAKENDSDK